MAETKATSVESEATATVNVITVTQLTAYISRGHERMKFDSHTNIAIEEPTCDPQLYKEELMRMKSFVFWVYQFFSSITFNENIKHKRRTHL